MNKLISLTVLAAFAVIGAIGETPVYQCDSNVPLPLNIQVNDCETLPCLLRQGSTVILNATFNADSNIDQLKPEVIAYVLGLAVNYPLSESDGCKGLLNSRCPIEEGENVAYQLQIPILSIFPQISLTLKFTIYGDETPITCFMVDAMIVGPNGKFEEAEWFIKWNLTAQAAEI